MRVRAGLTVLIATLALAAPAASSASTRTSDSSSKGATKMARRALTSRWSLRRATVKARGPEIGRIAT